MKICAAFALTLAFATLTHAQTHYTIGLDAIQESPDNGGRTGSGMGNLRLAGTTLSFSHINFCGMSSNSTAVHIHGPATAGTSAPALYDVSSLLAAGGMSGHVSGDLTLLEGQHGHSLSQQTSQLESGLWYLSIRSEAFPGGEIRGQILPSRAARILAVVRDRDGDPANGVQMNDSDDPLYLDRLANGLGHQIVLLGNSPAQPASPNDWQSNGPIDMVFISGSVRVADVAAAYRECTSPVIYSEAGISSAQSLADDAFGQAGAIAGQTELVITNPGHPLAGGLCGQVQVYAAPSPGRMNFLTPNSHMISVASTTGDPALAVVCGYEKGACMFDGLRAPARRLNLFMPETDTANALENAWALFDAGIAWSLSTPDLPEIKLLEPASGAVFAAAANGMRFQVNSATPVAADSIKLLLNNFDESANLQITGEPTSRTVAFDGLHSDRIYSARITASNSTGTQTHWLEFDTLSESAVRIIEAEDYDYDGGSFQKDPAPSGYDSQCTRLPADPGIGYAGRTGIPNTDYFEVAIAAPPAVCPYRLADSVGTRQTFDVVRHKHATAGISDYHVRGIVASEWLNYTSDFDSDSYFVYLRASRLAAALVHLGKLDASTGHLVRHGSFLIPDSPNCGFSYVPLTDAQGNRIAVPLSGPANTLRLTMEESHPSLCLNYLLFVKTSTLPPPPMPVIADAQHNGANFEFTFATEPGRRYTVQYAGSLSQPEWNTMITFDGTGAPRPITDHSPGVPRRFYRVGCY